MDIFLLAKVVWRKIWIIVSVPAIAAIAAFLFTMDTVDVFRSVAQISTGFTINDQVQLTEEKFNIRDADVKFSNLMNSMNSGISINLISYRLLLHDLDPLQTPFRKPDPQHFSFTETEITDVRAFLKKKLESSSPLSTADSLYNLTRKFLNAYGYGFANVKPGLAIHRVPNTDFIQVEFSSEKAGLSALAANAFCEEFIRLSRSLKTERTGESVEFLKQLVEEKKTGLDEKLETQKIFKSNNTLFDINRDGGAQLGQLAELERQRDDTRTRVQKLELTMRRLTDDIKNAGGTVTTSTNNNQSISDLRERINRLNERFITTGSTNKALADSLTSLRDLLLRLQLENSNRQTTAPAVGLSLPELQSKYKDAEIELQVERSSLNMTEAKIQNLQYGFSGFASKEAKLEAIQKEVDLASQEYLAAVEKFNEAKNRLLSSGSLRQILVAIAPVYPEPSKRPIIIALAGFSSLFICLFVVIALELLDVSIRTTDKFKRIVGLHLAGTLNKMDSKNFNIKNYFNQTTTNDESETYKSLLRKLRHEIENLNAKVILFTSPKKKDGKTFVIVSLSYVLSLINKRVLIIDTNFKNNSLSQILASSKDDIKVIEGHRANLLLDSGSGRKKKSTEPEEDESDDFAKTTSNAYDLINPTKYKNIYIVGNAGGGNESPAEILSGRDFNNLISVLIDSFDYILLEGASMNDYSDTKELVKYVDKVVAVFSSESTIKQMDRESISYFKSLGKKFGGCVLNKVELKDLKL